MTNASARFFFSSRRRHTRSVSAFLLNRSSDLYFATFRHHPTRQFLTESLVDGERSQSKSFSSCARIGRIFSFSASSPRSEERRVGKEYRSWWLHQHGKNRRRCRI